MAGSIDLFMTQSVASHQPRNISVISVMARALSPFIECSSGDIKEISETEKRLPRGGGINATHL